MDGTELQGINDDMMPMDMPVPGGRAGGDGRRRGSGTGIH